MLSKTPPSTLTCIVLMAILAGRPINLAVLLPAGTRTLALARTCAPWRKTVALTVWVFALMGSSAKLDPAKEGRMKVASVRHRAKFL